MPTRSQFVPPHLEHAEPRIKSSYKKIATRIDRLFTWIFVEGNGAVFALVAFEKLFLGLYDFDAMAFFFAQGRLGKSGVITRKTSHSLKRETES